ncbi:MAG: uroporphyrinogen-III synthase, partial [Candidatus Hinthialibacter sp.]
TDFFDALISEGDDARILAGRRIIALEEQAEKSLLERGIRADFVFTCAGLKDALHALSTQFSWGGEKILFLCEDDAFESLPQDLRKAGAIVDQVVSAIQSQGEPIVSLDGHEIDMLVFLCPTTVQKFVEHFGEGELHQIAQNVLIASLDSDATKALQKYNINVHLQSLQPDIFSLADCIVRHYSRESDDD